MKAMLLYKTGSLAEGSNLLRYEDVPGPIPADNEILIKITRCGVCHTELDEIEGRTSPPHLPIILGHQIVGRVVAKGKQVQSFKLDDRVGVAWVFSTCGKCANCVTGNENLCSGFQATGRDVNGGYSEYVTVGEKFAYHIPTIFSDSEAAPLLCAGAIGYRSMLLCNIKDGQCIGLMGFGGSAQLVIKMVNYKFPAAKIYVFARNTEEQQFARNQGAAWAGDIETESPEKLHSIIDTTPAWKPVTSALNNLLPGGRLVINAIRKDDSDKKALLNLDYARHLWLEKEIKSVANVCRQDVLNFLQLAAIIPIKPLVEEYTLQQANQALVDLKNKRIMGTKVLIVAE